MTFVDALIYSLLGMLVVFFALFLLMLIIKLMTAAGNKEKTPTAPTAAPAPAPAPGSAGELKLYDTEPRTAAMLMAIVADELHAPLNELRFISVREIRPEDEEESRT
ncbi:MAG: OadG family protein [Oscillospiraceae bacterium]|nr:OadG family protein [Oscillospiraceae bacterium]